MAFSTWLVIAVLIVVISMKCIKINGHSDWTHSSEKLDTDGYKQFKRDIDKPKTDFNFGDVVQFVHNFDPPKSKAYINQHTDHEKSSDNKPQEAGLLSKLYPPSKRSTYNPSIVPNSMEDNQYYYNPDLYTRQANPMSRPQVYDNLPEVPIGNPESRPSDVQMYEEMPQSDQPARPSIKERCMSSYNLEEKKDVQKMQMKDLKEEIMRLEDLTKILRDQQYIIQLLNNPGRNELVPQVLHNQDLSKSNGGEFEKLKTEMEELKDNVASLQDSRNASLNEEMMKKALHNQQVEIFMLKDMIENVTRAVDEHKTMDKFKELETADFLNGIVIEDPKPQKHQKVAQDEAEEEARKIMEQLNDLERQLTKILQKHVVRNSSDIVGDARQFVGDRRHQSDHLNDDLSALPQDFDRPQLRRASNDDQQVDRVVALLKNRFNQRQSRQRSSDDTLMKLLDELDDSRSDDMSDLVKELQKIGEKRKTSREDSVSDELKRLECLIRNDKGKSLDHDDVDHDRIISLLLKQLAKEKHHRHESKTLDNLQYDNDVPHDNSKLTDSQLVAIAKRVLALEADKSYGTYDRLPARRLDDFYGRGGYYGDGHISSRGDPGYTSYGDHGRGIYNEGYQPFPSPGNRELAYDGYGGPKHFGKTPIDGFDSPRGGIEPYGAHYSSYSGDGGGPEFTRRKIHDLRKQMGELQDVISSYQQKNEDRYGIDDLNKQIYDLKGVVGQLSKSGGDYDYGGYRKSSGETRTGRPAARSREDLENGNQNDPIVGRSLIHRRSRRSIESDDAILNKLGKALEDTLLEDGGQQDQQDRPDEFDVAPESARSAFDDIKDRIWDLKDQLENPQWGLSKPINYESRSYGYQPQSDLLETEDDKAITKKDDIFDRILEKIIHKIMRAIKIHVPRFIEMFFGSTKSIYAADDGYDSSNYPETGLQKLFSGLGFSGFIPLLGVKLFMKILGFIKYLRQFKFFKTFLVPAGALLLVAGAVIFLIWWLQPDFDDAKVLEGGYQKPLVINQYGTKLNVDSDGENDGGHNNGYQEQYYEGLDNGIRGLETNEIY